MNPDIAPELRPYRAEVDEAIKNNDTEALKRIVKRAGLEWIEPHAYNIFKELRPFKAEWIEAESKNDIDALKAICKRAGLDETQITFD